MLVQQGMAYGELAGDAPVAGLYPAIGAMVGYTLFWEFTTVNVLIEQDHIFLKVSAAVQIFLECKGE